MNKTWTRLCQANVDHYNNHPTAHTAIAVASLVGAVVLINKMAQKAGESQLPPNLRHK